MRDSTSYLVAVAMGAVFLLTCEGCGRNSNARSTDTGIAGDVPLESGGATGADGAFAKEAGFGDTLGSVGNVDAGGFSDVGGSADSLAQDGAIDAGTVVDGSSAYADGPSCGNTVCATAQLCVRPTCVGGTAPPCLPPLDGGACPAGLVYASSCVPGLPERGSGCTLPRCVDPPPFCIDLPAACGTNPTCACLPYNVCGGGGMCGFIDTSVLRCMRA
jgi:hypothetical protein